MRREGQAEEHHFPPLAFHSSSKRRLSCFNHPDLSNAALLVNFVPTVFYYLRAKSCSLIIEESTMPCIVYVVYNM